MADEFDSPFFANDLNAGERWFTTDHHGGSTQELGHDLSVRRRTGDNNWTCNRAKQDGTESEGKKNEDKLVWMKPVYAMRDGVVERSWKNAPDNDAPGEKKLNIGGDPGDIPSGGNHVLVRHSDDSLILYAHFAQGTLADGLCPESAERIQPGQVKGFTFDVADRPTIRKGQLLGHAGNSGQSTGPHVHIHRVDKNNNAQALPLARGMITSFSSKDCHGTADINQWTRLDGNPIPQDNVLFWPPRRLEGEYTRFGFPSRDFQRLFSHLADSGFWPEWINGYSVGGKVFYNFIWRPAKGTWRAHFSLTQSEFETKLQEADSAGFDPVYLDSFLSGGSVRYTIIFHKNKPGWLLRTDRTKDEHETILDESKAKGLSPVSISVVSISGKRRYSDLYRKVAGLWSAKSTISESGYQGVFDENIEAHRVPVYLKAYMHNGSPFVSAIFSTNPSGPFRARHGLNSSHLQSEFDAAIQAGFGTKVITAFDNAQSQHRYFGVWRK